MLAQHAKLETIAVVATLLKLHALRVTIALLELSQLLSILAPREHLTQLLDNKLRLMLALNALQVIIAHLVLMQSIHAHQVILVELTQELLLLLLVQLANIKLMKASQVVIHAHRDISVLLVQYLLNLAHQELTQIV